jgi:hypothetical protein
MSEQHPGSYQKAARGNFRESPGHSGLITRRQMLTGAGGLAAAVAFGAVGCSNEEVPTTTPQSEATVPAASWPAGSFGSTVQLANRGRS